MAAELGNSGAGVPKVHVPEGMVGPGGKPLGDQPEAGVPMLPVNPTAYRTEVGFRHEARQATRPEDAPAEVVSPVREMLSELLYASAPERTHLRRWAEYTTPKFVMTDVPNEEWEQRTSVLHDGDRPRQKVVAVPEQFEPRHAVRILEAIDEETFQERPEKRLHPDRVLRERGEELTHLARYVAERADSQTAEQTALDIFGFGHGLQTGDTPEPATLVDLTATPLTAEETATVDHILGFNFPPPGEEGFDAQQQESARREALSQYFAIDPTDEGPRPEIADRVEKYIEDTRDMPRHLIEDALFESGDEAIVTDLGKDGWEVFWKHPEGYPWGILAETLQIEKYKQLLDAARASGDVEEIARLERHAALDIQGAIGGNLFTRQTEYVLPSTVHEKQEINCIDATRIGRKLLKELGIQYANIGIESTEESRIGHDFTWLITADQRVYWFDFQYPSLNEEIYTTDFVGISETGEPITTQTISDYVREEHRRPLYIRGNSKVISQRTVEYNTDRHPLIEISTPETGIRSKVGFGACGGCIKKGIMRLQQQLEKPFWSGIHTSILLLHSRIHTQKQRDMKKQNNC